jgi:hypothetical protein
MKKQVISTLRAALKQIEAAPVDDQTADDLHHLMPKYYDQPDDPGIKRMRSRNIPLDKVPDPDERLDVERVWIAEQPGTTANVLEAMAQDPSRWVRWTVAANPKTPLSALMRLTKDPVYDVRKALTRNPGLPVSILKILAKEESEAHIRYGVLKHRNCDSSIRELLSSDPDEQVRNFAVTGKEKVWKNAW